MKMTTVFGLLTLALAAGARAQQVPDPPANAPQASARANETEAYMVKISVGNRKELEERRTRLDDRLAGFRPRQSNEPTQLVADKAKLLGTQGH